MATTRHLIIGGGTAGMNAMRTIREEERERSEITLVSAASDVLLGCTPEALLGDPERWLERVHSEDREILMAALGQLGRQVQPVTCEYRLAPPVSSREVARGSTLGYFSTRMVCAPVWKCRTMVIVIC